MKVRTQLFLANGLILVLLCAIALIMHKSTEGLIESAQWVAHTNEVISNANLLAKSMVDMETGQRGFMLTGDETFLDPYKNGLTQFDLTLKKAIELVSDNPTQKEQFHLTNMIHQRWRTEAGNYEIDLKRQVVRGERPFEAIVNVLQGLSITGEAMPASHKSGRELMDDTRKVIKQIIDEERRLLDVRAGAANDTASTAFSFLWIVTLLAVVLGFLFVVYISRQLMGQLGAEPEVLRQATLRMAKGDTEVSLPEAGLTQDNVASAVNQVAKTIKGAAAQANQIAGGDFSANIIADDSNDQLGIALHTMTQTLRQTAATADLLAKGNLDVMIKGKGDNDGMAVAMNGMVKTMREAAAQANRIASGDFSTDIRPRGPKDELGLALQTMTQTLRESTRENEEQDWLKTNLAKLNALLQGKRDMIEVSDIVLSELASLVSSQHGVFYIPEMRGDETVLTLLGGYAYMERKHVSNCFKLGEGLIGQCAKEKKRILLTTVPVDYIQISSGLGDSPPLNIYVAPVLFEAALVAVIEFASFERFTPIQLVLLDQFLGSLGVIMNGITTLRNSEELTERLQIQQEELAEREERTSVIINTAVDGIVLIDSRGIIESSNLAVERLFGYTSEELVGQNVKMIMPSPYHEEHDGYLANYARTGVRKIIGQGREVIGLRKDQSQFPLHLSVGEMNLKGRTMFAGMMRDITHQKAIEKNLQEQSEELRSSNEELKQKTEALQSQQEEMATQNEELLEQTSALKSSEEELQAQSEELQTSNEALREKGEVLVKQKLEIEQNSQRVEHAKQEVEQKARELEQASQYKSEFLANMSHELRTPLNSLLILADSLTKNKTGNLTSDQVEKAQVIHNGGKDLLLLINDILDLSKVEAGKLNIQMEALAIEDILGQLRVQFTAMAENKGLALQVEAEADVPVAIRTDGQRIQQILRNLLSNALKFTERGSVSIRIHRPEPSVRFGQTGLAVETAVAFSVTDTGIGISGNKLQSIFGAFQQADGSTSRRFGGTGLGLSISRELAKLLGGEIVVQSQEGQGSTFTLYLPLTGRDVVDDDEAGLYYDSPTREKEEFPRHSMETLTQGPEPELDLEFIPDDRHHLGDHDRTVLIIEDDASFATILIDLAREQGFKCLAAGDGRSGLNMARRYLPSAIMLDLGLPHIDGLTVLDALKGQLSTRHIPVHVVSAYDGQTSALQKGALGYLEKPLSSEGIDQMFQKFESVLQGKIKELLIVEDSPLGCDAMNALLDREDTHLTFATCGKEAYQQLTDHTFDCLVLDLGLPDMTGFELLEQLRNDSSITLPPVVVYTGQELTKDEYDQLSQYAESVVIKGASSQERLLDDTSLFLHSVESQLPEAQRRIIQRLHVPGHALKGRTVLVVDDDMRNTFALSTSLQECGCTVLMAADGQLALDVLNLNPGIDLVLMDVMMPVMDGIEAIGRIRERIDYGKVPIIALTALTGQEDREKALGAGANDFLTKPIDMDQLTALMNLWLQQCNIPQ